MKALSIRQPWAWLIVNGIKPVENRTWHTPMRGPILIHAGQQFDTDGLAFVLERFPELRARLPGRFDLGGVVGAASLVDCVQQHPSPWFFGPFGFVLADARPLPFKACRGQLSFFDIADESAAAQQALHTTSAAAAESNGQERLF